MNNLIGTTVVFDTDGYMIFEYANKPGEYYRCTPEHPFPYVYVAIDTKTNKETCLGIVERLQMFGPEHANVSKELVKKELENRFELDESLKKTHKYFRKMLEPLLEIRHSK